MKRFLIAAIAALNLLAVDAVAKEIAVAKLKGAAAISVVPGFFDLAYVENRGCAWGMFQGHVWPLAVFGLVALAFLVAQPRFCSIRLQSMHGVSPLKYASYARASSGHCCCHW